MYRGSRSGTADSKTYIDITEIYYRSRTKSRLQTSFFHIFFSPPSFSFANAAVHPAALSERNNAIIIFSSYILLYFAENPDGMFHRDFLFAMRLI